MYSDEAVSSMVENSLVIDGRGPWSGFCIRWMLVIDHCLARWTFFYRESKENVRSEVDPVVRTLVG
jgi:hypothetical protein